MIEEFTQRTGDTFPSIFLFTVNYISFPASPHHRLPFLLWPPATCYRLGSVVMNAAASWALRQPQAWISLPNYGCA